MIDKDQVHKIAKLSRLTVTENQVEIYSKQLSNAMKHFEEISAIDTTGVEPMITPTNVEYWTRVDEAKNPFTTEELMQNAPDRVGSLFKVPPVV